jgi:hypothetical protein
MRRNEQEARLEADRLFTGVFALGVGEDVRPQVAQLEANEDFSFLIDGLLAAEHQMLRLLAGNAAIETHVGHVIAWPVERRDLGGDKGFAILGFQLADVVEITDAGDVQIEIGLFRHDESPWKKSGDAPCPDGKRASPARVWKR